MVYIDIYVGMILNQGRREGQRGPEGEGQVRVRPFGQHGPVGQGQGHSEGKDQTIGSTSSLISIANGNHPKRPPRSSTRRSGNSSSRNEPEERWKYKLLILFVIDPPQKRSVQLTVHIHNVMMNKLT